MRKFRQFLTELTARNTIEARYYRFKLFHFIFHLYIYWVVGELEFGVGAAGGGAEEGGEISFILFFIRRRFDDFRIYSKILKPCNHTYMYH